MPHITWCLTGHLTFLPIHTAGFYGGKGRLKVFDCVVSSYTPTVMALLTCGHPLPESHKGVRLLAVSQSVAQGQEHLPGTTCEVNAIQALQAQNSCLHITTLNGKEATLEAVLQSMKHCNWVHLACHGVQDLARPTNSTFLINGRLMLNEVMKQSFSHTELAVLSACQTATGNSELPDKAIHLAAGMLMAGYGSVAGTMWSIYDNDTPIVAEKFYAYLIGEAAGDSTKAAYALHTVVGYLQDFRGKRDFARWVPFIHLGICSSPKPS